ncbi:Sec-independent protein translocase subunit TatA [Streptomyces albus subsp. chlorinus]|uniref:Sec-independent protein translocase subunit TatA n=1 Tax=Streptomyces albus TaxID=1888 RepID=UPI0031F5F620
MFLRNGLEPWHLLIVAVVAILVFGSRRLPETARALGVSLRILKSETRAMKQDPGPAPAQPPATTDRPAAGHPAQARSGDEGAVRLGGSTGDGGEVSRGGVGL